ncbi:MAG: AsmA family protein [Hyphomicrobiaceae bacterium]|nr:AsmA family protein [Hyphomicrobiaceae bacterium]
MNGALLWIAGLIVALLAALFAVPYAVDWNSYRGLFEEEASRMLGREVRVGGDVNLRLLPAPYVRFERPRIADAGIGEAFFRAESFTMWLAPSPLLQGIIEAKQIELKRPALRLQIDREGGGNWSTFRISRAALPFVPRGIALQSLKISDGVVAVHGVDGEPLARIEIADGELSAPALEGPYKLRADVRWDGDMREVRASTAAPDEDGSVRLKLAVRAPQSGNAYTFDGRVTGAAGRPQLAGNLTATIPVSSSAAPRPSPAPLPGDQAPGAPAQSGAFEVRAAMSASALSARLSDIAFSFEQNGRPQLLTGTAEASWQGRPVLKASLSSRWLDLDRIADVPAQVNALETARRLSTGLMGYLPTGAEVAARIAIDQANVAGDVVSGLVLAVENSGKGLTIKELRASLPGGSRMDVSGSLSGGATAEAFDGDILLRGANLGRFLAWAARGSQAAEARGDSGFSLSSRLSLGTGGLEIHQASLDAGPNRMTGDLSYRWEGRRQLALSIETAHADISGLLPGALGPDLLKAKLGGIAGAGSGAGLAKLLPGLAETDARVRIRADVLTDGTRVLHNVDADVTVQNGTLQIPSLRASTPAGFELELDGEIRDLATRPNGALRGVVAAASQAALDEALEIAPVEVDAGRRRWLAGLAPLRLAFVTRFGLQGKAGAEISIDGHAHGEMLAASLRLDGGLGGWRNAPIDAMLASDSAEVARAARGLLLGGAVKREGAPVLQAGRLLMKAVGTPAQDTALLIELTSADVRLTVRGRGAAPPGAGPSFKGELEIAAADASRAAWFAGLGQPAGAAGIPLQGRAGVEIGEAGLAFDFSRFEVGDTRLAGQVRVTGPQGARRLDADLKSDAVSLPRIVALALDGGRGPDAAADALRWRDEPFDLGNLEHLNGRVKLQAGALALGDGFGLSDAVLEIDLGPGRFTVSKLEGRALGGAMSSAFKLEKTAAGATLSGVLGLWDIRLDQIAGASNAPFATGRVQLSLQFTGQAVTPRALIPVLKGKGELELKSARWERLSPGAIETAADAVLAGRTAASGEPLRQALRTALAAGPLPLGSRKIPVEVGEGALRVAAFPVDTPQALMTNETTIDLAELKIDSEWKVEPKAARSRTALLPGMSVIFVGPLQSLASLEPRLAIDALERELAVRGMERDVEHLEQLRKEDEARARAEAERLKALEQQQSQQMQVGPQPPTIDVPFPFPAAPATAPVPQHLIIEPKPQPRPVAPRPEAPKLWGDQWPRPEGSGT